MKSIFVFVLSSIALFSSGHLLAKANSSAGMHKTTVEIDLVRDSRMVYREGKHLMIMFLDED